MFGLGGVSREGAHSHVVIMQNARHCTHSIALEWSVFAYYLWSSSTLSTLEYTDTQRPTTTTTQWEGWQGELCKCARSFRVLCNGECGISPTVGIPYHFTENDGGLVMRLIKTHRMVPFLINFVQNGQS